MKKLFIWLLILGLFMGLTGCSDKVENNTTNVSDDSEVLHQSEMVGSSNAEDAGSYKKDPEFPETLEVNFMDISYSVDMPTDNTARAGCGFYCVADGYFVYYDQYRDPTSMVLYEADISTISATSEILPSMKNQITAAVGKFLEPSDSYELHIDSSKESKDRICVEGTVKLISEYAPAYESVDFASYAFFINGLPVYFMVFNNPLSDVHVDISNIADRIVDTYRSIDE